MKPRVAQLYGGDATDGQVVTYRTADGFPAWADPNPVTVCRATFAASGGESVLYLNATPVASSEQVFVNGHLKTFGGVDYTLTGSVITFTAALSAADRVVVSYITATSCGIATLSTAPTGFTRPVAITRPVRRFHRIR